MTKCACLSACDTFRTGGIRSVLGSEKYDLCTPGQIIPSPKAHLLNMDVEKCIMEVTGYRKGVCDIRRMYLG